MTKALFDLPKIRKHRYWRMRVIDAGQGCIQFRCPRCGHNTGWIIDEWTVAENRRGLPCPNCNNLGAGLKSASSRDEVIAAGQPVGLTHKITEAGA